MWLFTRGRGARAVDIVVCVADRFDENSEVIQTLDGRSGPREAVTIERTNRIHVFR